MAVGDAVFGLAHGCLGTRVVGPAAMLAPMPPHLAFHEAATVPTVRPCSFRDWYTHSFNCKPF